MDYQNELASHKLKQSKIGEAINYYSNVLIKAPNDLTALIGILKCYILSNNFEEFKERFDRFEMMKTSENAVNLKIICNFEI